MIFKQYSTVVSNKLLTSLVHKNSFDWIPILTLPSSDSKFQIEQVDIRQVPVLSSAVNVVDTARDLGVTIDSRLTLADQVAATCRSTYFQLQQLWLITRSLSSDAAKAVVHAFILCRLDYCNSLLFGIADDQLQR